MVHYPFKDIKILTCSVHHLLKSFYYPNSPVPSLIPFLKLASLIKSHKYETVNSFVSELSQEQHLYLGIEQCTCGPFIVTFSTTDSLHKLTIETYCEQATNLTPESLE